jgi:hypothetical protein
MFAGWAKIPAELAVRRMIPGWERALLAAFHGV